MLYHWALSPALFKHFYVGQGLAKLPRLVLNLRSSDPPPSVSWEAESYRYVLCPTSKNLNTVYYYSITSTPIPVCTVDYRLSDFFSCGQVKHSYHWSQLPWRAVGESWDLQWGWLASYLSSVLIADEPSHVGRVSPFPNSSLRGQMQHRKLSESKRFHCFEV